MAQALRRGRGYRWAIVDDARMTAVDELRRRRAARRLLGQEWAREGVEQLRQGELIER